MLLDDLIRMINPERPLIITDVDEVVLNLLDPLQLYLGERNFEIDISQARFGATIRDIDSKKALSREELEGMIDDFFELAVDEQPLIEDALESLASLRENAEVVALTNLPHQFGARRRKSLLEQGFNVPLLTNEGPKGPAVKAICEAAHDLVYFIDDTAFHHKSVAENAPHVHRIHFIGHPLHAANVPPAKKAHIRIDSWPEIVSHIENHISENSNG